MSRQEKAPVRRLLDDLDDYRWWCRSNRVCNQVAFTVCWKCEFQHVFSLPQTHTHVARARFQSHFKSGAKQDYVTWGKLLFVQYGKSRRTQIMTCGFISLIDVVHRHVAKLFLIQIETRPESYGINE